MFLMRLYFTPFDKVQSSNCNYPFLENLCLRQNFVMKSHVIS